MASWYKFQRQRDRADPRFPRETPLRDLRFAVLDTELTSLDSRSNRLLSVGAIAMDGSKIRIAEQFYPVVNPGVAVPARSVLVHKLRPNDVEQGVMPHQALAELKQLR